MKDWICKIFGHKVMLYTWGMKWCSRCDVILEWGEFTIYKKTENLVLPKYKMINPEDL